MLTLFSSKNNTKKLIRWNAEKNAKTNQPQYLIQVQNHDFQQMTNLDFISK